MLAVFRDHSTGLHGGAGVAGVIEVFLKHIIRVCKRAIDIPIEIASINDAVRSQLGVKKRCICFKCFFAVYHGGQGCQHDFYQGSAVFRHRP